MGFELGIEPGETIDNAELVATFKCSPQAGMRRSLTTGTLVLVSRHLESVYDDRWVGDVLHCTGMGLQGDQRLDYSQNRTLAKSDVNGIDVHLFEVYRPREYTYIGRVTLAGAPYAEWQADELGSKRRV